MKMWALHKVAMYTKHNFLGFQSCHCFLVKSQALENIFEKMWVILSRPRQRPAASGLSVSTHRRVPAPGLPCRLLRLRSNLVLCLSSGELEEDLLSLLCSRGGRTGCERAVLLAVALRPFFSWSGDFSHLGIFILLILGHVAVSKSVSRVSGLSVLDFSQ